MLRKIVRIFSSFFITTFHFLSRAEPHILKDVELGVERRRHEKEEEKAKESEKALYTFY